MVKMLCNYGPLRRGYEYVIDEANSDWVRVGRIHVPVAFVLPLA